MAGPAVYEDRDPEDEPFDVVRANSSVEESPSKMAALARRKSKHDGDELSSEMDVNSDSKELPLTRNVTGGQGSSRTRPMSPPSRAGLDDPETYQNNRALTRGPSYRNEMPMDERQEYDEEMKALALCDVGDASQGLPEFCGSAMMAVNEMCAGGLGLMDENPTVERARIKMRNLKLDGRHTPNSGGNVEEQTAIEVEYVEPQYRGKNDAKSPSRKNALLKAMTRKAKDDWKSKGRVQRENQDVVEAALNELAEQPNDNVYATFSAAEKRKFLQLINGGSSPFEATSRVLKDRAEGVEDEGYQSEDKSPTKSGKKSRKLAFWKKTKKDGSTPGSAPSTPSGKSASTDGDDDGDYENVGDEIKQFLKEESQSDKSGSAGAEFQKSGISYYDGDRKDQSEENEGQYYNGGQYPDDSKGQSRKLKIPKGLKGMSMYKNRGMPVPGEEEATGIQEASSFDEEKKADDSANVESSHRIHVAQKSPEEIVQELNMDAYMGSARSVSGAGTSKSFDGAASVASAKSHKTSGTNFTTQSTRSRRVGQAKVRQQVEKNILNTSVESTKTRGWQESIEAAAAQHGKVWDPETGWQEYKETSQADTSADGFSSHDGREIRRTATGDSSHITEPDQLPLWKDTRRPPTPSKRKPKSPRRGKRSPKSASPSKGSSPAFVTVGEEPPRGWAETMKAATAKLNLQGKNWDPEKGWTGLSEEEAQSVSEAMRQSQNSEDIAVTASSDMQDFGTINTLDKIANQQDRSMQFLSEEEEANSDGEGLSVSKNNGKYMQIGETGSVQEYQRRNSNSVFVRKTGLNQNDAEYFPDGTKKVPVDADGMYDQQGRSIQGNGSFDDAVRTDFSWEADETTTEHIDNTDNRKAVPRLKIKIRESARQSGGKELSEGVSFDSTSSIPKLAAPRRDTSPIRVNRGTQHISLTPDQAEKMLGPAPHYVDEEEEEEDEVLVKETISPPPPKATTPTTALSPVAQLHQMWEKRTKSWDKNLSQQDIQDSEDVTRQGASNSDWKTFLTRKVQAETAAVGGTQSDAVLEFDHPEGGKGKHEGAFDDISELSPIRQADESDSEYLSTVQSEASTSVLQGTTFLQRLQACAGPVVTKGGQLAAKGAVAASEFAKKQNCSPEGSMDVKAQFAAMRQRQGILQASAGLCGPTETISEVGEDDTTFQSSMLSKSPSMSRERSRSNPRSRQKSDDMSSVVSDGFGSQSAYLEAIAMKAATGGKKKKKRSQGSEVSAASGGPSEVSGSSAGNSKHSEKFQQFLDRRASREASSPPQQISTERPPSGRPDVSSRAEHYASEKMNEMMDSMADRDNRETGAFPTDPSSKSQMAAEELAAARVETMMQTLSSQNLEDNEGEI